MRRLREAMSVAPVALVFLFALASLVGCSRSQPPVAQVVPPTSAPVSNEPADAQPSAGIETIEAQQLWDVAGYAPTDPTYSVNLLGEHRANLEPSAGVAYLSDDGATVYTAYPAALRASDGTAIWEGKEAPSFALAFAGDGIYLADTLKRLWPRPGAVSKAELQKLEKAHPTEGSPLLRDTVDLPEVARIRPKSSWEEHAVCRDSANRWWLFYERSLSSVPGSREPEKGEWQFMMFDASAKSVAYTRTTASVGWMPLTPDSTPDQTSYDLGRILVLPDGRFVAGATLAGQDESQDARMVPDIHGVAVKDVFSVEGSAKLIRLGMWEDPNLSDEQKAAVPDVVYYDTDLGKAYSVPDETNVVSASRDGHTLVSVSVGDSPHVSLWRLP